MPRALLSVSDKRGLVDLARGLAARGYELVSTGGTARVLAEAGLPVVNVSEVTGFPEMMDGRVKTLHPKIHGGILARRAHPEDLAAIAAHGIGLIDVVVVNLYPFAETARKPGVTFAELVEQIDIGGPSMVRAAAKNFRDVLIVVEPDDYPALLTALDGDPSVAFRFDLMRKALAHTAAYDTAISETLATLNVDDVTGSGAAAVGRDVPVSRETAGTVAVYDAHVDFALEKIGDLRYGENPHQRAAWYRTASGRAFRGAGRAVDRPAAVGHGSSAAERDMNRATRASASTANGLGAATVHQGKELSYTNLLDLDAAARIALEFVEPAAVVIKHTNPCGAATGDTPLDAYVRARDADSVAAFGGIVALNRPIDAAVAAAIVST